MKNYLLLIFILFFFQSISQNIEIGQDAKKVKETAEWIAKRQNEMDSYGNKADATTSYDVKYKNGVIDDVILCYYNAYQLDMKIMADFCIHYLMKNEILIKIIKQYQNISIEKLIEFYDKEYNNSKINNLYFTDDYKYFYKLYLASNGFASVECLKTDSYNISNTTKNLIEKKLKEKEQKEKEQKEYEIEFKKKKEIRETAHDLEKYDTLQYKLLYNILINSIYNGLQEKLIKKHNSPLYFYTGIPYFKQISQSNLERKKFRFSKIYNIKLISNFEAPLDCYECQFVKATPIYFSGEIIPFASFEDNSKLDELFLFLKNCLSASVK